MDDNPLLDDFIANELIDSPEYSEADVTPSSAIGCIALFVMGIAILSLLILIAVSS